MCYESSALPAQCPSRQTGKGEIYMRFFPIGAAILFLLGYTSRQGVIPYDTDDSRSGGTITMSARTGVCFDTRVNWTASERLVLARCRAWAYSGYAAFSGVIRHCIEHTQQSAPTANQPYPIYLSGTQPQSTPTRCTTYQVDQQYQCTESQ